ncbi:hypothetical protein GCM10027448_39500 [Nocardioides dilutus]
MVALCISLLALVAAAAGAGYAAGLIGTAQLKNNAVTAPKIKNNAVTTKKVKNNAINSKKVKNGTLSAADMVAEEKQIQPTLSDGGEGDCVWSQGPGVGYGFSMPTYRKDRFGRVHMTGYVVRSNAPGGDGACDGSGPGQINDAIAFILPAGYIPAKTTLAGISSAVAVIAGPQGITAPGVTAPPGAVMVLAGNELALDNVSFDPAGAAVALPKMTATGQEKQLVDILGLD